MLLWLEEKLREAETEKKRKKKKKKKERVTLVNNRKWNVHIQNEKILENPKKGGKGVIQFRGFRKWKLNY